MNDFHLKSTQDDLRFVRETITRTEDPTPILSRILWSSYCLIGYTLLDFIPQIGGTFMLIGFAVCMIVENVWYSLFNKNDRERNREQSTKYLVHALSLTLAIGVVVILAHNGIFQNGYSMGQIILVLIGYHFITIGLFYTPKFELRWNLPLFLGITQLIAAVLVSFFSHGVWTVAGVIMALTIAFGFRASSNTTSVTE